MAVLKNQLIIATINVSTDTGANHNTARGFFFHYERDSEILIPRSDTR